MTTTVSPTILDYSTPPALDPKSDTLHEAEQILNEIMQEAEEESRENPQTQPISSETYKESLSVLCTILNDVSMPDLMWLEDGGIGFEWRRGLEKIFTLSLYGDGHGIFVGIFGERNKIRGITPLSSNGSEIPHILRHTLIEHFPSES
jgi:hypothetical protein